MFIFPYMYLLTLPVVKRTIREHQNVPMLIEPLFTAKLTENGTPGHIERLNNQYLSISHQSTQWTGTMNLKLVIAITAIVLLSATAGYHLNKPDPIETAQPDIRADMQTQQDLQALINNNSLETLTAVVRNEVEARLRLEAQIKTLSEQLARLQPSTGANASPHQTGTGQQGLDEKALLEAGVAPDLARTLRQRYEGLEMEQLYLRDRAVREGWSGSDRYREEFRKLNSGYDKLRGEFGEQAYDAMLYASGQDNRVIVASVMAESPAKGAGLQNDDIILSYGDQRIYNWGDLRSASSEGQAGETVSVTLERKGQRLQVYMPRGPLGVRLDSKRVKPDTP